jgi:hypothetical protein
MPAGGEGHGLPMVPPRGGHDTLHMRHDPEKTFEVDEPAAYLEGSDGRLVLVLDPHGCAASRV